MEFKREIKYESELDKDFAHWITSLPAGEKMKECIQCGTCSGSCPVSVYMDYTPREIIAMARMGFKEEVLKSYTIWLCASCYACTVYCPMKIKITDLMYELKQRAIREGYYPKRFTIPVMAKEFFNMVRSAGRNTESYLLLKTFLKSNPTKLLLMAPLGMKLFISGRLGLKKEKIRSRKELKTILDSILQEKS